MNTQQQTVEVKDLPEMTVAYVRNIGPYKGNPALFEKLFGSGIAELDAGGRGEIGLYPLLPFLLPGQLAPIVLHQ